MAEEQRDLRVPAELVPRCPVCGGPMAMNLRVDDTFVQDDGWYAAAGWYEDFLRRHQGRRVLFLELGVGGILQVPLLEDDPAEPQGHLRLRQSGGSVCAWGNRGTVGSDLR